MPLINTTISIPATALRCDRCGAQSVADPNSDRLIRMAIRAGWATTSFSGSSWACPQCAQDRYERRQKVIGDATHQ